MTRMRVRIDRLPDGWVVATGGFLLQLAIAVGMLFQASVTGSRIGQVNAAFLVGVVVLAGLAAVPSVLLLWAGRHQRSAAVLAVVVAAGMFVLVETYWLAWLFPLALIAAAIRAWAGAGLDATTLLRFDPDRFERVDPAIQTADDPEATGTPPESGEANSENK